MANFGMEHLLVVAPYAPHWREARSAVGAPALLQNARETESLADAVTDCTLVVGTGTLTYRKPEQRVVPLPALAPIIGGELARGGRVAVVFGPEKHGLTRDDLSYCHLLVEIPTDPRQPSMNLGQAVAVCMYELAARGLPPEKGSTREAQGSGLPEAAASGNLDLLAGLVEQTMEAAGYSPHAMQEANRHDLRLLLRRLSLTQRDIRRILGLFRRILWRLNRHRQGGAVRE
jgi:tRNA/rRNA methyltransferase